MSGLKFKIDAEYTGKIIGGNGRTVRRLRYTYHSDIKVGAEGDIEISNGEKDAMAKAKEYIISMCHPTEKKEGGDKKAKKAPAKKDAKKDGKKDAKKGDKKDNKKDAKGKKGDKKDAKKPAKKDAEKKKSNKPTSQEIVEKIKEAKDTVKSSVKLPAEFVHGVIVMRRGAIQRRWQRQFNVAIEADEEALSPKDKEGNPLKHAEAIAEVAKLGNVAVTIIGLDQKSVDDAKAKLEKSHADEIERTKEKAERKDAFEKKQKETTERRAKLKSVNISAKGAPGSFFRGKELAELQADDESLEVVLNRAKEGAESSATIYSATEAKAKAAAATLEKKIKEFLEAREEKRAAAAKAKEEKAAAKK